MNIIGPEHPFFEKPAARYITVAVCVSWAMVEWAVGDAFWGVLTTGIAGLAAWQLIFNYKPQPKKSDTDAKP